jgi:hypothetical protein
MGRGSSALSPGYAYGRTKQRGIGRCPHLPACPDPYVHVQATVRMLGERVGVGWQASTTPLFRMREWRQSAPQGR